MPTISKYEGAIDIQGMTCGSCVKTIESNVSVIPGVLNITVNLLEKEASVVLDPTVVTMNEVLDKINSMGFIASERNSTGDKTREAVLSPDPTKHGDAGQQADLASVFGGTGATNLERGDHPSPQKSVAATGEAEGASKKIAELTNVVEGRALLEEKPVTPKRRLSTKPAYVGSLDLHPVVESKISVVVFDVETSGPAKSDEVVQLSATCGHRSFNTYVLPVGEISSHASRVHSITKVNGRLFYRAKSVAAKSKVEAWKDFIRFCAEIRPVLLVGHNVMFDARFAMNELAKVNLHDEFLKVVAGFSDTLPLMRGHFPDLERHTQARIVSEVLGSDYQYDSHNSEADVASLMIVLRKLNISDDKLIEYSFTASSYMQHLKNVEEEINMEVLYSPRRVTKSHLKKLAVAGYTLEKLKNMAVYMSQDEFIETLASVFPRNQTSVSIYETLRKTGV